jgi:hypothetical protein
MMQQNQNSISPFLVIKQQEGAEKALYVKVIAALFQKGCILSFLL